jgi:hypothetical protein
MAFKTDQNTQNLLKEVNKRKQEIAKLEKPSWKTNCSFSYIDGNLQNTINVHVESNVKNLVSIVGHLLEKQEFYKKAAQTMELDSVPDFTWGGFTVQDWTSDIKTRISKIQIAAKRKKLESLEEKLNKLMSPELRAELELEEIAKELEL